MGRFTVEIDYAGHTYTFTDEIDAEWSSESPIASGGGTSPTEFPVEVILPDDVPALVEAGYPLTRAVGRVYVDGVLVLQGRAVAARYGDPTEPLGLVRLTFRQSVLDDVSLWPGAGEVVDATTWPEAPGSSMGRVYPQVWGAPCGGAASGAGPGSPAIVVESTASPPATTRYILIAGHPVEASTVYLYSPEDDLSQQFTVVHVQDGRGHTVAVVDYLEHPTAFPAITVVDGPELWVIWRDAAARSGAAGGVIADMLAKLSIPIDLGRLAIAVAQLDSYELAFYLDERVNLIQWLGDNVVDLLPVVLVRDQGGLYPAVWRADVTTRDAVATLTVGRPDCVAVSDITYGGDPVNAVTLRYRPRADTGDHLLTATADPDTSYYAEVSRERHRTDVHDGRFEVEIETDIISAIGTAERIVHEQVRRQALPPRTRSLELDREVWGRLRAGDLVLVVDDTVAWPAPGRLCWIERRADDADTMRIDVAVQEDPLL